MLGLVGLIRGVSVASGKKRQRTNKRSLTWHQIYEEKMKLLILATTLAAIVATAPSCAAYLMPQHPQSTSRSGRDEPLSGQFSWLLNRPVMGDPLFLQMKQHTARRALSGALKKSSVAAISTGTALARHRHWQAA